MKILLANKTTYDWFMRKPLLAKVGMGAAGFFIGKNIISSVYDKIYDMTHFESMHSGKNSSLSSYVNMLSTDFGSKWKGLHNNILRLIGQKNEGISKVLKETITPFTDKGVNLNKTMMKISRQKNVHKQIDIREKITNYTLELSKNRINHTSIL